MLHAMDSAASRLLSSRYPARRIAAALLLSNGLALSAGAAIVSTDVSGFIDKSNNGCTAEVIARGDDCSYNGSDPVSGTSLEWIGPVFQSGYYAPGAGPDADTTPVAGDGKSALALSGSFLISDAGDGFGANDLVSFSLTLAAGVENADAGLGRRIRYSWDSITWSMPFTAVNSVTANGLGGFDYVIGSAGLPGRIQDAATGTDFFTSETASTSTVLIDGSYWAFPSMTAMASFEGNLGGAPSVSATGWACAAGSDGASCAGRDVTTEQFWNNLLVSISTNSAGRVINVEGFGVAERDLSPLYAGLDSWDADRLSLTIVPIPATGWLLLGAFGWLGALTRRRRN